MAKFNEMPLGVQLGIVFGLAVAVTAAGYFLVYKAQYEQNKAVQAEVAKIEQENAALAVYEQKKPELERKIASLELQLENQRRIVPDEKEADKFMHMMQDVAAQSGIEIRRYAAKPASSKEYYTEVPFDIELDGQYYAMLNFFERVAKLDRIINMSNLKVASVSTPAAAKHKYRYPYSPSESVLASAVATTFFSHDAQETPPAAPGKGPAPAGGRAPGQAPAR